MTTSHASTAASRDGTPAGSARSLKRRRNGQVRFAAPIRWVSLAVFGIACIVMIRSLPFDHAIDRLQTTVGDLGFWGPIVFGLAYVAAAVLFVPGAALTVAAGALFGPLWGTVTVSVSSTTAAALAFLISRFVAREKVEKQAKRFPKFAAIDEAIGKGGARIVAMLRLSPAVPFSLGNYLYGLTSIRFWPYVLASWMFMLPGTFMYVYLGHVGQVGLSAAAGSRAARSPAEWALLIVGLLATVAVTVYVTRLARKAIREQTRITSATEPASESDHPMITKNEPKRWPLSATLLPLLAVAASGGATYSCTHQTALSGLFGPPKASLQEAYADERGSLEFDHSVFDGLLRKHVDSDGWIDYAGLRAESATLDGYLHSVARVDFDKLGRDEKLVLLINAYNAFTLRLILDHYPIQSIKGIPDADRWDAKRWNVGGNTWSLNEIEHEQIRPKFVEPRVHFALVCAAIGCPTLRNEAYRADRIDEQLDEQTRYVHAHDRWFQLDARKGVVQLTKLYDWYGGDFKQVSGSVLDFAARYSPELKRLMDSGIKPRIEWLDYDWTLNDRKNKS